MISGEPNRSTEVRLISLLPFSKHVSDQRVNEARLTPQDLLGDKKSIIDSPVNQDRYQSISILTT